MNENEKLKVIFEVIKKKARDLQKRLDKEDIVSQSILEVIERNCTIGEELLK